MSDPYSYDYDEDVNPYSENQNANLDDVDLGANTNTPPPPPPKLNPTAQSSAVTPPPPPASATSTASKSFPASKKTPPKTTELEGFRAKKLFGFMLVGNLPFPILNPNYFTYIRWSGHWMIVPVSLFELFLVIVVLLFNLLGQWLFLGASIDIGVGWPSFVAVRLVWAHVIVCLVPCAVYAKYAAMYRACTEKDALVKAPLYMVYVIFALISTFFYVAMWTGGVGSGLFSAIFFLIGGLANNISAYTIAVGVYDFLVSIGWALLIACSVIQVGGMARNYYLYRQTKREAKAAINAV